MASTANAEKGIADNGGTGGLPDQGSLSYSPSDVKGLKRVDDKEVDGDRHVFATESSGRILVCRICLSEEEEDN